MEGVRKRGSTDLDTGEGDLFSILGNDEGASGAFVIQHTSEPDDLQILITNILDGGNDPDFGGGRDLVGGSRERDLKTIGGADSEIGVSADYRKTKSEERERAHRNARAAGDESRFDVHQLPVAGPLYTSWNARGSAVEVWTDPRDAWSSTKLLVATIRNDRRVKGVLYSAEKLAGNRGLPTSHSLHHTRVTIDLVVRPTPT